MSALRSPAVSDYHDLFLAVDLRPDLPGPFLDELGWHLGLTDTAPPIHTAAEFEYWGGAWQVFAGPQESHAFAGADTSVLVRAAHRTDGDGNAPWALTARACVHEDEFGIVMGVVCRVLRQATTRGWAGFVRGSGMETMHHIVCDDDGLELVEALYGRMWLRHSWA